MAPVIEPRRSMRASATVSYDMTRRRQRRRQIKSLGRVSRIDQNESGREKQAAVIADESLDEASTDTSTSTSGSLINAPAASDSKRSARIRVKVSPRSSSSSSEELSAKPSVSTPSTILRASRPKARKSTMSVEPKHLQRTALSAPRQTVPRLSVEGGHERAHSSGVALPQGQQEQNPALLQSAQALTDAMRHHQDLLAKQSSAMQAQHRQLEANLIIMKSQVRSPAALLTRITMLKQDLSEQLDDQVELYEAQQKFHKLKTKLGDISMVGLTACEEDLLARQRGLNERIKKNREELAAAERDLLGVRDAQLHIDAEKTKIDDLKAQHDKHVQGMEWWDAMTRLVAGGPECDWDVTDLVKISQTFITWMEPRLSGESSESS
ncbi:hypothetical protein BHE90_000721 [Fusarium euwallaceae]|uniref:Uncharacterized protein n=2 Tax=Fusarium solani species complex TaxID=232080 RepID=A0A3M2SSH8_9HYPO|nr:hypothetical protein CDV36_000188 [Fusarium kuroshium]RTE84664.1 hypothetical protein BHE90_000721 [Fusarium euwallaceae]